MNLPDMSGDDVCCTMRSDPSFSGTAIIFHTGMQASGATHKADAFLTYPVQVDDLVMVLLGRINNRRSRK
jgi:CheY-like chemotaxis protein